MGEFVGATLARVPSAFNFSGPLHRLFAWIEAQGYQDVDLYGSLRGDTVAGTVVELRGYTAEQTAAYARDWFGEVAGNPASRLWPFAQTGGDGSMAALRLDEDPVPPGAELQGDGFAARAGYRQRAGTRRIDHLHRRSGRCART
jgi:hypothetical protein